MQSMKGGYDIIGLEWFALEVKRHEKVTGASTLSWWVQCKRQAAEGQEPVLFYRPNNINWRIMMYGYVCVGPNGGPRVKTVVDIDLAAFLVWFEMRMIHQLREVLK